MDKNILKHISNALFINLKGKLKKLTVDKKKINKYYPFHLNFHLFYIDKESV
jgi:hypothetical protein